jgi:hypothetical protein
MVFPASGEPAQQPSGLPERAQEASDQAIEATALAGSAAIRRIIGERNELRRERERLCGVNEELRRQNEKIIMLRDHYRQLATELLVQLRQMYQAIQEASRKVQELSAETENRDTALTALARRFSAGGNAK